MHARVPEFSLIYLVPDPKLVIYPLSYPLLKLLVPIESSSYRDFLQESFGLYPNMLYQSLPVKLLDYENLMYTNLHLFPKVH